RWRAGRRCAVRAGWCSWAGLGCGPRSERRVAPAEVEQVALAAERERRQAAQAVLEVGPAQAHRAEVGVVEQRAVEGDAAQQVDAVGERGVAHAGQREAARVALAGDEPG